jgi:hypothetical protein
MSFWLRGGTSSGRLAADHVALGVEDLHLADPMIEEGRKACSDFRRGLGFAGFDLRVEAGHDPAARRDILLRERSRIGKPRDFDRRHWHDSQYV